MKAPLFLTLDEVLAVHADQVRRYGGTGGIRDVGLLASALGTVQVTFDQRYLHSTLEEMAAAYPFHISQNHPFVDGNKRVALAAALIFLMMNGIRVEATEDELVDLVWGVARGEISKSQVSVFFEQHRRV